MSKLAVAVMIAASTISLASLAFFNGFPLVLGDTGGYILDAPRFLASFRISWTHPIFYSMFILPLHLNLSPWPIVVAQSLIVAHLLFISLRVINRKQVVSFIPFLAVILILTVCTSLPWVVGQIMADVFTGIVILGLFLLGFGLDRLTRLEKVYIFFLTAAAISFHFSHLPLALGLVLVTVVLPVLFKWDDWFHVERLALLVGPIILAISVLLAVNMAGLGQITLSPGSRILLLARLIEDGTARMYLDDTCPEKGYALCSYRDELNSGWHFLWSENAPLKKVGGAWKLREEASEIIWGSLRANPVQQLHKSLANFFKQIVSFSTGSNVGPRLEGSYSNSVIRNVFGPSVHTRYVTSRQNRGTLPIVPAKWLHNIAVLVSFPTAFFLFVTFVMRKEYLYMSLFILIMFGLIANAFLTGVLSTQVDDRYQSRVIWLIVFYAIVGSAHMLRGSSLSHDPIYQNVETDRP